MIVQWHQGHLIQYQKSMFNRCLKYMLITISFCYSDLLECSPASLHRQCCLRVYAFNSYRFFHLLSLVTFGCSCFISVFNLLKFGLHYEADTLHTDEFDCIKPISVRKPSTGLSPFICDLLFDVFMARMESRTKPPFNKLLSSSIDVNRMIRIWIFWNETQ